MIRPPQELLDLLRADGLIPAKEASTLAGYSSTTGSVDSKMWRVPCLRIKRSQTSRAQSSWFYRDVVLRLRPCLANRGMSTRSPGWKAALGKATDLHEEKAQWTVRKIQRAGLSVWVAARP